MHGLSVGLVSVLSNSEFKQQKVAWISGSNRLQEKSGIVHENYKTAADRPTENPDQRSLLEEYNRRSKTPGEAGGKPLGKLRCVYTTVYTEEWTWGQGGGSPAKGRRMDRKVLTTINLHNKLMSESPPPIVSPQTLGELTVSSKVRFSTNNHKAYTETRK